MADATRTMTRATDPDTSRLAAHRAVQGKQRLVDKIGAAVRKWPGRTTSELANKLNIEHHKVHKRMADAERAGLIRRGMSRVCHVKSSMCLTWYPPSEGTLYD